jgi:hypothetical protein
MNVIYRYPGYRSFTRELKDVFFGRNDDIRQVIDKIDTNNVTILFGRSGYGKTSLIDAGLIPRIEDRYEIIKLRFYPYDARAKGAVANTAEVFRMRLQEHMNESPLFLDKLGLKADKISPWQYIKTFQQHVQQEYVKAAETMREQLVEKMKQYHKNSVQDNESVPGDVDIQVQEIETALRPKGILLIMDQFEEIFTYPKGIEEFSRQLSEVLYNRMPPDFQTRLYDQCRDVKFVKEIGSELALIENEKPVKILVGIRWDKKGHLHKLKSSVSFIEQNEYELKPLSLIQAKEAIVGPALVLSNDTRVYKSQRFVYNPKSLETILDFLSNHYTTDIEAFQLQIICRYVEKDLVPLQKEGVQEENADNLFSVTPKLGINNEMFEDILKRYYQKFINSKVRDEKGNKQRVGRFSEFEKLAIRFLIEKKLIDEKSRMRMPPVADITLRALGFEKNPASDADGIIEDLITSRLIREEPNTRGGNSYELCHDTMIRPILDQASKLGSLPNKLASYYDQQISAAAKAGRHVNVNEEKSDVNSKQLKRFISRRFINSVKDLVRVNEDELDAKEKRFARLLKEAKLVRSIKPANPEEPASYELYEQFQNTAIETQAAMARQINLTNLLVVVVSAVVMGILLVWSVNSNITANREINLNRGQKVAQTAVDTIADKTVALQLLDSIYRKTKNYNDDDTSTLFKKIADVFKECNFQSKEIVRPNYIIRSFDMSDNGQWILMGCIPLPKTQDASAPRIGPSNLLANSYRYNKDTMTYFIYNRYGVLKDSLTTTYRDLEFMDNNEYLVSRDAVYRYGTGSTKYSYLDSIKLFALNNLKDSIRPFVVDYPYIITKENGETDVYIVKVNSPLKITDLRMKEKTSIKPNNFKSYTGGLVSGSGKSILFTNKTTDVTASNPYDMELWSIETGTLVTNKTMIKRISKPGKKIWRSAFFPGTEFFYVISDSVAKKEGDSTGKLQPVVKVISVYDPQGNELNTYYFSNARIVDPEMHIGKSGKPDYFLFINDSLHLDSDRDREYSYFLDVFAAGSNKPMLHLRLGNTNSMQSSLARYFKNKNVTGVTVNTRNANTETTSRNVSKGSSITATSRVIVIDFTRTGKTMVDSFSFNFSMTNTSLSASGDTIFSNKADKENSSVILVDRKKKAVINEFTGYIQNDYDRPINYFPLAMPKDRSLLLLQASKEKLLLYDFSMPLVNTNDAKSILGWLKTSGIPPLKDSVARKYLNFKKLFSL